MRYKTTLITEHQEKSLGLLQRQSRFVTSAYTKHQPFFTASVLTIVPCCYQGVGGAVELAPGYLKSVYDIVRKAGGVCIADEVQTGFGRTGSHYWGFETQGVVPDIVTMAKVCKSKDFISSSFLFN